jgi:hypothetical protein
MNLDSIINYDKSSHEEDSSVIHLEENVVEIIASMFSCDVIVNES